MQHFTSAIKLWSAILFSIVFVACQKPIEERIASDVQKWTEANCPRTIDALTRLDSMTYDIPSHTVRYHYAVSDIADSPLYWTHYDHEQALHRAEIAKQLRLNTEIKELVANKCTFQYVYHSASNGQKLYTLTISPADYQ